MSFNQGVTKVASLEELLSHHGERFVRLAYQVLLGRMPDPEGLHYYLARIQSGVGKVEILAQLSLSEEGRLHQVKIPRLDEAIRRHKLFKIIFLGSLLRIFGVKRVRLITQQNLSENNNIPLNLIDLLRQHGIDERGASLQLTLETIHRLNPSEHFDDIHQLHSVFLQHSGIRKLRIYDDDVINANFYIQLAQCYEVAGREVDAVEFYHLSLLFASTPEVHECLGNIALRSGRNSLAIAHYKAALDLNSQSFWVIANLAQAQKLSSQYEEAVKTVCAGIKLHPGAELLARNLDHHLDDYWNSKDQEIECIAVTQNREKLIIEYDKAVTFVSDSYHQVFRNNSIASVAGGLNSKRVLIVGLTFDVLPQCFRYRIEQKIEQLKYAGYAAETVPWHNQESALNLINSYDLIIFYRVPTYPSVLKLIEYAKSLGKITFYELDDLLFETVSVPPIETYGGQISLTAYTNITKDIGACRAIAAKCDYAIASTLPLIEKLATLTQTRIGYLHRNGLDKHNQWGRVSSVNKGYISLFYGSGTLAHNTDFLIEALPAISRIFKDHRDVKLTVVGHLTLPSAFLSEFKGQVIQVPFVKDIEIYWAYLSASDINLAVLHDDALTACKSELKWFEAATFSIPSIVSRTKNYLDVIRHGEDGFVVSGEQEWYSTLKQLIANPNLRKSVGSKAFERVKVEYSVAALATNIDNIMKSAVSDRIENNKQVIKSEKTSKRKKIAVVNILYPPNASGGATRIVVDEVSTLKKKYGSDFELVVFTADTENAHYYKLTVYPYDGYRVYAVTVALTVATNWHEKDEKIAAIFSEFLAFEQPDLVHFHCIQALTGSVVEVTQRRNIPYWVTVHDAWWISDHQFLIDQCGRIYPDGHPDPFEKFALRENTSLEQSLKRRSYLKGLLSGAVRVLAVSDTFRQIYEKNGIANIVTNKNGISNEVIWEAKKTEYTKKVVCGHVGGMSLHKGFDIFKQAVGALESSNIEVLIVDQTKAESYFSQDRWGVTLVTIIGRVNQKHIVDLYQRIDVLFAPSVCLESFGLVTREAAACGCWVVGSDVGAISEDITSESGFKITPTVDNLITVLNEIDQSPKKYKGLSRSGYIRYSSDQVAELVEIFNKTLV